jgi:hypothetical protein
LKKPGVKENETKKVEQQPMTNPGNNLLVDDLFGGSNTNKPQPVNNVNNNDPWGFVNVETKPQNTAPVNQMPDFFTQNQPIPQKTVQPQTTNKPQGMDPNDLLKNMYSSNAQLNNNMGGMFGFNQPQQGFGVNQPQSVFNFPQNQGYGMNQPQPGFGMNQPQPGYGMNQSGFGMNQPGFGMNQQQSGFNFPQNQGFGMNQMNYQFNQMNLNQNKNTPQFSEEYINNFRSLNAKTSVSKTNNMNDVFINNLRMSSMKLLRSQMSNNLSIIKLV